MPFSPSPGMGREHAGRAWWFLFSGPKLLVRFTGETAVVPYVTDLSGLGLDPIASQCFGILDDRPCLCGDLGEGAKAPDGMGFSGLRRLYGLMEEDLFWAAGRASQVVEFERTHKYCGRCGSPTVEKSDERARVCPSCGNTCFPRMSPAIIVSVQRGREILLARATRFPEGLYSVLAGFVDPGESLEECVMREVREEVGIEVKDISYFGSQPWPFPNSLMVAFTALYAAGEIRIDGKEIVDARWFSADNLPLIPEKISIARRLIARFLQEQRP